MGAPARGFAVDEYRARTARAQALMADSGLDVLLLTTEPEVRYFSGFLTPFWHSPTRPFFLLVPAAGDPVAVVPAIAAATMAATWLTDVRQWPSPRPADEGVSLLADTLAQVAGPRARVGVPMGAETHLRMPLGDYQALWARLPEARVADATGLIRSLRTVKSDAEVAKIAEACRRAGDAFDRLPEIVAAGMAEREAFRAFRIACLEAGVDEVAYLVGGAGPGGLADIISPPTHRPLTEGDLFMLDTGCVFDGYWCDFDRTYSVGRADDAARRAYARLHAATEAGLAAARPGTTCAELHHAMAGELGAAGGGGVGRLGHGLGMQLTEWPSIQPDDHTELVPGMVMTLEPGIELSPGRAMVQEENLLITDGAPRLLTRRAAAELPSL